MKMKRGELVGFQKCLGYDYDPLTKTLSINEEGAKTVGYIFKRYVAGAGSTMIARELNEQEIPTVHGNRWSPSSVIGKAISYTADNYTVKPSIDFSPSWCAFSYEGEFSFCNSKRQKITKSSLFNWRQSVSATATISHVDLSFSLVHYHNELQEGNHLNTLLGDASAVWRMKKLRLSTELRNLFNKKNYMETIYSGISTTTDSYYLRPRELMISWRSRACGWWG